MNITDKVGDNQQQMTVAGLDFETMQDNFNSGRLHIICHANVFHLYQKKAEVLLVEERPKLASVLGTRESSYIGSVTLLSSLLLSVKNYTSISSIAESFTVIASK